MLSSDLDLIKELELLFLRSPLRAELPNPRVFESGSGWGRGGRGLRLPGLESVYCLCVLLPN